MRYVVDSALCCGHGRCYALAPEVFSAGDDGRNAEVGQTVEVSADMEEAARSGAQSCPESAIVVFGDC
jgi:ferredoxin